MIDATMSDVERLERLLMTHWAIRPTRLQALSTGHTNKTYRVDCGTGVSVLRVSWRGKPVEQVRREASMLDHLHGASLPLPAVPCLQPAVNAQPYVQADDGSWLHLFGHIDGTPGLPGDAASAMVDAMHTLAHLHTAMATLPVSGTSSLALAWLNERYARVCGRPAPPLPMHLLEHYELLLQHIGMLLTEAAAWVHGPARGLHGDYHAGNLLFVDGALNGVLDFDDTGHGVQWLEAVFALFAMSRDTTIEDRFTFDAQRWDMGLHAYASKPPRDDVVFSLMREKRDALVDLFCAEQTLIHLEAAQRGLWMPGPGMGFLACWRRLLASTLPID